MKIIYTTHAKIRMRQRRISEEEIRSAIDNPNNKSHTHRERVLVKKGFPQGALEVVIRESGGEIVVITCYWIKEE